MAAAAKHILVETAEECQALKDQITSGEITFEAAAKEKSQCPSGAQGGDLGIFDQGQMVPEFDKVIFNDELKVVHGPVQTQFGYHLIFITNRDG
ncbi:MAG: Peptidyl-prolyl cis-trans isomerase PpiC (EC [uncultured Sulfurovum sp.]|uniref:Peptidyl-prolyl cis-trans isomerase C n=1 Tax=uncultured Sulfurovum sp. TaxID=269237 RepID=A0A6S6SM97_9BACT|nr:MAG: Peptidyl-prolyl cis-trans isomerase PpiC (EC [uncultured Sulfurovum sp.]